MAVVMCFKTLNFSCNAPYGRTNLNEFVPKHLLPVTWPCIKTTELSLSYRWHSKH